jgi:type VI secretion system protein ImpL
VGTPFLILLALGALTGIAAAVLVWRARKPAPPRGPCCSDPADEAGASPKPALRDWLGHLRDAADYLVTRREWRYATPWVLLLGEAGAGKRSLMASSSASQPPATGRQASLAAAGAGWHFFDKGVVISADTGPDDKGAQWKRMLRDLELLRPERALDGLLLAVSARSLLQGSAGDLARLAQLAQRQLADVQEQFDFILPVYVVVTQCDVVDGFAAYWGAQPAERQREMFGWSIPPRLVDDAPGRWADSAFDTMAEQLKALQLDAAAQCERIADVDEFFLFPRHFQHLRTPLRDWLEAVFQATAWQAGFRFRGLYFTGSVAADGAHPAGPRKDVAFVDQLVTHKVLAERNLAQPTRSGVWSRSRLIRGVQATGLLGIAAAALCLWLSTISLQHQVEVYNRSFALIHDKATTPVAGAGECAPQERVYELLAEMARLDGKDVYLAMPVSALDIAARHRDARNLAHEAFDIVIMPALACRLKEKSQDLLKIRVDDGAGYEGTLATLERFLRELGQLEHNVAHFQAIEVAVDQTAEAEQMAALVELTEYAYGTPLPDAVRKQRGELAEALAEIAYHEPLKLAPDRQTLYLQRASSLARQVSTSFAYKAGRGATLLEQISRGEEPLLKAAREFTTWLKWTRSEWIGATPDDNPCKQIGAHLAALAKVLPKPYQRPDAVTGTTAGAPFNPAQCYAGAVAALTRMHVPPYGRLFTGPDPLKVTPGLAPELEGLIDLSSLEFAQLDELHPFTCQPSDTGWRPSSIAQADKYLRQYGEFARKRGLAPFASGADRPLYDRLARRLLEGALNHTLREAQAPEADPPLFRVSLQATARSEQRLARTSAQFDQTLEPLLAVLRMAAQDGLADSGANIAKCARDYSADSLGRVAALAAESRLYDPDRAAGSGRYPDLGSEAITVDYLDRQVARAQVLAGYAAPYVRFLQNTDAVDDTHLPNEQTAPYWNNTIGELNRWVQFRDAAGQVGQLRDLFLNQLAKFDAAGCGKLQGDHAQPAPGNDMFSRRRLYLEERLRGGCSGERETRAQKDWIELATRFNRELAGRFPFAGRNAQDAAPATVKAFFADYAAQGAALRQSLATLSGTRWDLARRFLAQLDAVAAFIGPNLAADGASQPLRLNVGFHARPAASPGSEQVVAWTMIGAGQSAGYPNRASALDWQYGQPLELYLQWADRSLWRPFGDPRQGDLQVEGATASFAAAGDWALLRLADAHRPKNVPAADPLDRSRVLLEFAVPVLDSTSQPGKDARDTARLYLTLHLSGKDPRTQAPLPLVLPTFPRFAPD